MKDHRQQFMK